MSDIYDEKWIRFVLISKPEQSGKTFIMIRHIITEITDPIKTKEIINIILCDNNLLLAKQTSGRVEHDLREYIVDDVVYIELSSHSRTDYHDFTSVFHAIVTKNVRNIICCTNGRRMDDIYQLINDINRSEFTTGKFHFNIWLDEADKFIKFIDNTLIPIVQSSTNVDVKLITATSDPLFKHYKYINVLPIEHPVQENYHGWTNNIIRIIEKRGDYLDYIEHILGCVAPHCIIPGTKWLIPGKSTKRSHIAIKDVCIEKGMAVICVNSDGIILYMPHTLERIDYKKDDEFNKKIVAIYREQGLHRYPFVITGNICIGRGITIMCNKFMIDYGILSYFATKSEASQIAGRFKGNIKGLTNYRSDRVPTIFTTPNFNEIAIEWEHKSIALAKLAFKKEQEGLIAVVDRSEFKTCDKNYDYIKIPTLFNSFEEAKQELVRREREMMTKVKVTKKSVIHECEGYLVTSKLLTNGETVESLTKEHRLTKEKAALIANSRCISSTDKGSRYLILPVYENESSLPRDVKYEVRYIRFEQ